MIKVKKRIDYLLKHNMLIYNLVSSALNFFLFVLGHFVKIKENLVLINSYSGLRYNDSPKTIFEYLISCEEYKHLHIVWAFESPDKFDIPCDKVKIDSIRYFLLALQAKYWISNVNIERGLRFKKKQTVYLNTWHGTPLKYIGSAVRHRKFDFSNIDIFCCTGEYDREIYIRDFNVKPQNILKSGLPRNDKLYSILNAPKKEELILRKKKILNIPINRKVILYAPTWRDSKDSGNSYDIALPVDFRVWKRELGDEYVILFRAHSFTTNVVNIAFNDFLIDCSSDNYDLNDLLQVSDILISDYSSIIFDFSILEKPVICFVYDYEQYKNDRGLYIDLEKEFSDAVCYSQKEVLQKIKNLDYLEECARAKRFKEHYLYANNNATELCVNSLFKKYKNND